MKDLVYTGNREGENSPNFRDEMILNGILQAYYESDGLPLLTGGLSDFLSESGVREPIILLWRADQGIYLDKAPQVKKVFFLDCTRHAQEATMRQFICERRRHEAEMDEIGPEARLPFLAKTEIIQGIDEIIMEWMAIIFQLSVLISKARGHRDYQVQRNRLLNLVSMGRLMPFVDWCNAS